MSGIGGPSVAVRTAAGVNTNGHGFTNPSFASRGQHFGSRRIARVPRVVDEVTLLIPLLPRPRPIFVDDTGRRGLLLGWLSVGIAVVAASLIVAFWVSQATSSGVVGPPVACVAVAAGDCGVPAGG